MKSKDGFLYKLARDFSKLPDSSKITIYTLGIIVVLLLTISEIYKEQRKDRKDKYESVVEALENCQKSKRELEEDFIDYLKEEKRILENKRKNHE